MTRGIATEGALIEEARRLRMEERLSLGEIGAITGVGQATLSVALRDVPLNLDEKRKARQRAYAYKRIDRLATTTQRRSRFADIIVSRATTTDQKGAIAEAAAIVRMKMWGYRPYLPLCPHGKADMVVEVPETNRIHRVQVKMVKLGRRYGRPVISLYTMVRSGKALRKQGDFDFLVGYNPAEDVCYVYAEDEIKTLNIMTVDPAAVEAWDKMSKSM